MRPALTAWLLLLSPPLYAAEPAAIEFRRDIQPILADHCYQCHGPDAKAREAELRFDARESALRAEEPVIVPGKSGQSELIRRITTADPKLKMPPPEAKKPLTAAQIERLTRWIDAGAAWSGHWAYEPLARPALPKTARGDWSRGAIDVFVLARLEREGLAPAAEASRERLLRRVTLDLTGLPPTLAELDAFLADETPDAYERAVDRLLASPRYGERMSWEWLEAARYADTNGFQGDPTRSMWPWRDWLVAALNANRPFDQLTVEQLAGDLLPEATLAQRLATGFHRNHMHNGEGGRIAEETRIENIFDRVETTATVWLGQTMTCARCHDHKYDPVTQRDYYGLFAIFNNSSESGAGRNGQEPPLVEVLSADAQRRLPELRARQQELEAQTAARETALKGKQADWETQALLDLEKLPAEIQAILKLKPADRAAAQAEKLANHYLQSQADLVELRKQRDAAKQAADQLAASGTKVMVLDETKPRETTILERGNYQKPGAKVVAALPAALFPQLAEGPANRLSLARWLVDPRHPLTSRVTVNRVWQQFFGQGLVRTTEDFGLQGEPPSHPELLDWLAADFVAHGWDLKRLHRQIVTSAVYRQEARVAPALAERDPENRLLARGPRGRLGFPAIRDSALFAAGLLVEQLGGPPVRPYQPPGVWEDATFGTQGYTQDHGEKLYRRSLYTFWKRIVGPTMFFDVAARQTCTVRVERTNTPLHALAVLNDVTYLEAARALAERTLQAERETGPRIERAFRLLTSRRPSDAEREILTGRLAKLVEAYRGDAAAAKALLSQGESKPDASLDAAEHAAWTALCALLMNLDEALSKP